MIMYLMTITIVKWWSSQLITTVVIIHLLLPKLREYVNGSKSGNAAHLCVSNTSANKTTSDKFFLTNTSASKGLHSDIFFFMFSNKLDYIILLVCSLKTISKCNWFVKSLQPLSSQQPIPHLLCFSTWKMLISKSVLNTTNKFQMALSEARWYQNGWIFRKVPNGHIAVFSGHIDVCACWYTFIIKYILNIKGNLQYIFLDWKTFPYFSYMWHFLVWQIHGPKFFSKLANWLVTLSQDQRVLPQLCSLLRRLQKWTRTCPCSFHLATYFYSFCSLNLCMFVFVFITCIHHCVFSASIARLERVYLVHTPFAPWYYDDILKISYILLSYDDINMTFW